jgi:glutathione S-transferase
MAMRLYFSPLSCSLACSITAAEAGVVLERIQVNLRTKRLKRDGADYLAIAPKGQVPALLLDDGTLLTEVAAVLLMIADQAPTSGLAPREGTTARYRLIELLSFLGSELHKHAFYPLFAPDMPSDAKAYARETALPRKLRLLEDRLRGREFLLGESFTVADAYLVAILNWTRFAPVSLDAYGELSRYLALHLARPKVASCVEEDAALFATRNA